MRKLILCTASIALLGACGEAAMEEEPMVDETVEPAAMTDANGDTMEAYLGDWNVTYPDGSMGTSTNNADGTYAGELPDGTAITGTWTFGAEESCWTPDGDEAESACYAVGAPDENGLRELTMADGTTITVSPMMTEEMSDEGS